MHRSQTQLLRSDGFEKQDLTGTIMKWSNKEASNKETRRRSMRASWEPPDARRSGEDRVEKNARLGYRLGKEVLAVVENTVILLPRKLAVKRKEPRLQSFPGGDRILDNIL